MGLWASGVNALLVLDLTMIPGPRAALTGSPSHTA